MTYRVVVTREGKHWLADVPAVPGAHTYAPNLAALDRNVREVIVLGVDLPDEAMADLDIEYEYDVEDDLIAEAAAVGRQREELARQDELLQKRMQELAALLTRRGYSVRDAGPLLRVSPGRISQVKRTEPSPGARHA